MGRACGGALISRRFASCRVLGLCSCASWFGASVGIGVMLWCFCVYFRVGFAMGEVGWIGEFCGLVGWSGLVVLGFGTRVVEMRSHPVCIYVALSFSFLSTTTAITDIMCGLTC